MQTAGNQGTSYQTQILISPTCIYICLQQQISCCTTGHLLARHLLAGTADSVTNMSILLIKETNVNLKLAYETQQGASVTSANN